jgi:hypothetical protein
MEDTASIAWKKWKVISRNLRNKGKMKNKDFISGEKFLCPKHGLDYRIVCEICQRKYAEFFKVIRGVIRKGGEYDQKNK